MKTPNSKLIQLKENVNVLMATVSEKNLIQTHVSHVSKIVPNVLLEQIMVNVLNVKKEEKNLAKLQN